MLENVSNAALLLLAKIAQADGVIDPTEKELLHDFSTEVAGDTKLDEILETAKQSSLDELCAVITKDADKFFIRLRCHLMVTADGEVDSAEQTMLDSVLDKLVLDDSLTALLDQAIDHQLIGTAEPDMDAIHTLYEASSFA